MNQIEYAPYSHLNAIENVELRTNLDTYFHEKHPDWDLSDLHLIWSEKVIWNNSSLGCAEPGKCYLQVITPGYVFAFAIGSEYFFLHTNENGTWIARPSF